MDMASVVDWSREAIRMAIVLGAPLLLAALVVGLVVGVIQTLTQMHEPVVGQVPRLLAVAVMALVLLPWMLGVWVAYARGLIESLWEPVLGGQCPVIGRTNTGRVRPVAPSIRIGVCSPEVCLMPPPWLLAMLAPLALVFARVAGLAWTAPGLSTNGIGWRVRVGLAILLTMAVAPAAAPKLETLPALARLIPIELAVGAMMGLSASLVLAGARQAGELVGVQAGLSPASLLDPDAGEELNPLAHLYGWMALAAFLALDGPLALVGSLVESYRAIPAGGLDLSPETVELVFARVGWALGLTLRAAAPAAVALIAAGVAMGLLGRAAPSLSLLSYSLPIRVGVGLVLVLMGLGALAAVFASAWREMGILR